jgi:hypothetical protein
MALNSEVRRIPITAEADGAGRPEGRPAATGDLRSTTMTFIEAVERSPFLISDSGIETRIAYETDIPLDP